MTPRVDLIVNPYSGPAARRLPRAARLAFATRVLQSSNLAHVRAIETHSASDGVDAARRAVADGVARVVVWGGDGTVNAVAAELAGSATALAIVPGGSGNGFARELGVPLRIEAALRFALEGSVRSIDLGLVNGRPFVNVAGIGLDAAIAHRYDQTAGRRRGLRAYVRACVAEVGVHTPTQVSIRVGDAVWFTGAAALVAVANGRQYGHRALIAPGAALDDGELDVVMVPDITRARALRHGWRLFTGTLPSVPGVRNTRGRELTVEAAAPSLLHRDGEVERVIGPLHFTVRPRALHVVGR